MTEVKTNIPYEIGVMTCTTVLPVMEDGTNGVTKAFLFCSKNARHDLTRLVTTS